jgi:hypothetical protein
MKLTDLKLGFLQSQGQLLGHRPSQSDSETLFSSGMVTQASRGIRRGTGFQVLLANASSVVERESGPSLSTLVEEIVVCILCFCDIRGVLMMSEVRPTINLPSVESYAKVDM